MHDRRDRGDDCGDSRHEHHEGGSHHHHHDGSHHHHDEGDCGSEGRRERGSERGGSRDRDRGRSRERGGGADTRFLQLEMSKLLSEAAETVSEEAFHELLLEAAKTRLRERFGDKITGLAQLAVDKLLNQTLASLDIEARIQEQNEEEERAGERLRDLFRKRDKPRANGNGERDDEERD